MSSVKHILFDNDGVLVDTEYTAAIKMTQALIDLGINLDTEYYLKNHSGSTFSGIMRHYFGENINLDFMHKVVNKVEAQVAENVKLVQGMDVLLRELKINKSVVSNSSLSTVKHALKVNAIDHHFEGRVFSSEQVAHPKPAPDLYFFAIQSLRLNPEDILVIEDSMTGVQAAVSAGLNVIGFSGASHIRPGHNKRLEDIGVVDVASSTEGLGNILASYINLA